MASAEVLKCPKCGTDASKDKQSADIETTVIKKAEVPEPMIPHSFASPELFAHVAYEKYCNGMPLYRQEKDFKGHDVILSRATMANWIIYAAKGRTTKGSRNAGRIKSSRGTGILQQAV